MSWESIAELGLTVRPLSNLKPPEAGRFSPFNAAIGKTVKLLDRELRMLDATRIVLELDLRDRDIRVDGLPRSNAAPTSPCVVLSFESKFGPLRYATCEYRHWDDNLRAIALAMEALRAVDRYGVSKRGEQYLGWRAIPMSTDPADSLTTREQAREYIDEQYGGDIRTALFESHPDRGGNPGEFRRVMKAKELLA